MSSLPSSSATTTTTSRKVGSEHLKPSANFIRKTIICILLLIFWVLFLVSFMRPFIGNTLLFLSEFQFQPPNKGFDDDEDYQASKFVGGVFSPSSSSSSSTSSLLATTNSDDDDNDDDNDAGEDPKTNNDEKALPTAIVFESELTDFLKQTIIHERFDLCGSIRDEYRTCLKKCTPQLSSSSLSSSLFEDENNQSYVEILPEFPCFPSACRCPAPECILEKRIDPIARKIRRFKKNLEKRIMKHHHQSKTSSSSSKQQNHQLPPDIQRDLDRLKNHQKQREKFFSSSSSFLSSSTDNDKNNYNNEYTRELGAIHDEFLCVRNPFMERHRFTEFEDNFDELECTGSSSSVSSRIPPPIPPPDMSQYSPRVMRPIKILGVDGDDDQVNENSHSPNKNESILMSSPLQEKEEQYIQQNQFRASSTGYIPSPRALEKARIDLHRFKRATSWSFSRWRNWAEEEDVDDDVRRKRKETTKIKEEQEHQQHHHRKTPKFVAPPQAGIMSGEHDQTDGLYKIQNLCIQPDGPPLGYEPNLDRYRGIREFEKLSKVIPNTAKKWLNSVKPLEQQPSAVLDMRIGILPLDWKSNNNGHSLYRFFTAANQAKKLWGKMKKLKKKKSNNNNSTIDSSVIESLVQSKSHVNVFGHHQFKQSDPELKQASDVEKELVESYLVENHEDQNENDKKPKKTSSSRLKPEDDFHVMYLVNSQDEDPASTFKGYNFFYQFLGSSWSAILSHKAASPAARRSFFSKKFLERQQEQNSNNQSTATSSTTMLTPERLHREISGASSPMVCFKEVVIFHFCFENCDIRPHPGNAYFIPYLGKFTFSQKLYIRHFREKFAQKCLMPTTNGGEKDNNNNNKHNSLKTRVTLIVRKYSRADLGMAHTIPTLASRLGLFPRHHHTSELSTANNNLQDKYELRVVSQSDLTPNQFLHLLYSKTDILIGSMGASLSFTWLLPTAEMPLHALKTTPPLSPNLQEELLSTFPLLRASSSSHNNKIQHHHHETNINKPSILVEISASRSCAFYGLDFATPGTQGWNMYEVCDFGGFANAIGAEHLAISLPYGSSYKLWSRKNEIRENSIDEFYAAERNRTGFSRDVLRKEIARRAAMSPLKVPASWVGTKLFDTILRSALACREGGGTQTRNSDSNNAAASTSASSLPSSTTTAIGTNVNSHKHPVCKWDVNHQLYQKLRWGVDS